jgi:hypothetical protein
LPDTQDSDLLPSRDVGAPRHDSPLHGRQAGVVAFRSSGPLQAGLLLTCVPLFVGGLAALVIALARPAPDLPLCHAPPNPSPYIPRDPAFGRE